MQNQIQKFSFNNQNLQIINKNGEAWFIAREVANLLGYRDAHNLTRLLDDDEKDTHNMSTPSGNQDVSIINESGFYHAAFKSRKPEVKPFRKWVTTEVLPQIRKTGKYENSGNLKPTSPIEQLENMPTRSDLWNLYLTLMDIMKDVNGWGSINFEEWVGKNNPRRVSSDKLTYQELLDLIRKMHAILCSKYHYHPLQNFYKHAKAAPALPQTVAALPQPSAPTPLTRFYSIETQSNMLAPTIPQKSIVWLDSQFIYSDGAFYQWQVIGEDHIYFTRLFYTVENGEAVYLARRSESGLHNVLNLHVPRDKVKILGKAISWQVNANL